MESLTDPPLESSTMVDAAELAPTREFIEIPGLSDGHDADRADPAPAIRLAGDPTEAHRQFALFEGGAGTRRTAEGVASPGNAMQRATAPSSAQPRN